MTVVVCVVGTSCAWERSEVGDSGTLCVRQRLCLGEIRGNRLCWERSEVGDSGSLCGRHRLCLGKIKSR